MRYRHPFRLLDLPSELRSSIFEKVDDQATRAALSLTCRALHEEIERFLYQTITLASSRATEALKRTLTARHETCGQDLSAFAKAVEYKVPMQNLVIAPTHPSVPCCKFANVNTVILVGSAFDNGPAVPRYAAPSASRHRMRDNSLSGAKIIRFVDEAVTPPVYSLIRFRICHANLGGPGNAKLWTLNHLRNVFLHPTLEELHIEQADSGSMFTYFPEDKLRSTSLMSLDLHDCDVVTIALEAIVSIPRALKRLRLTQVRTVWIKVPLIREGATSYTVRGRWLDVLKAIDVQNNSLEELALTSYFKRSAAPDPTPLDFSPLTRLRRLTLDKQQEFCGVDADTRVLRAGS